MTDQDQTETFEDVEQANAAHIITAALPSGYSMIHPSRCPTGQCPYTTLSVADADLDPDGYYKVTGGADSPTFTEISPPAEPEVDTEAQPYGLKAQSGAGEPSGPSEQPEATWPVQMPGEQALDPQPNQDGPVAESDPEPEPEPEEGGNEDDEEGAQ